MRMGIGCGLLLIVGFVALVGDVTVARADDTTSGASIFSAAASSRRRQFPTVSRPR